ncbi:helix-turn-helix domain-containing protein [Floridanema aerugineum]|uniref:Helix-turn-helix domain-containing protein n=1 Tax=Floridaenema aerugineum BLCC-F46 TaxID=3153654 RepID=A0ABV4XA65_9CYAN
MSNLHIPHWKKCRALNVQEKLISLPRFAKELNYSPDTVRVLIKRHSLVAYKIAGKWYLRKDDIKLLKKLLRV